MPFACKTAIDLVSYVEIPVSGTTSNVYALGRPGDGVLVDCGTAETAPAVIATLEQHGWRPGALQAIIVTHGHGDHHGGAALLADWSRAPVWAHLAAAVQIEDPWGDFINPGRPGPNARPQDWAAFQASVSRPVRVDRILREADSIELTGLALQVLHVPGHDRSEIALWDHRLRSVFVGDLVQGGMDASSNWLGLFTDVAGQRRSLDRIAALDPRWLFKGHRQPRSGDDVRADLAAAGSRLDKLEAATIEALEPGPRTAQQVAEILFHRVLKMDHAKPAPYALVTAHAFLLDLAQRGRVSQRPDLTWELAR